jgi:hypothetical protein
VTAPNDIVTVAAEDLVTAWRTLHTAAQNYQLGSKGEERLIEAARLMEVELRTQHGDEVWAALMLH